MNEGQREYLPSTDQDSLEQMFYYELISDTNRQIFEMLPAPQQTDLLQTLNFMAQVEYLEVARERGQDETQALALFYEQYRQPGWLAEIETTHSGFKQRLGQVFSELFTEVNAVATAA